MKLLKYDKEMKRWRVNRSSILNRANEKSFHQYNGHNGLPVAYKCMYGVFLEAVGQPSIDLQVSRLINRVLTVSLQMSNGTLPIRFESLKS